MDQNERLLMVLTDPGDGGPVDMIECGACP